MFATHRRVPRAARGRVVCEQHGIRRARNMNVSWIDGRAARLAARNTRYRQHKPDDDAGMMLASSYPSIELLPSAS